MLSTDQGLALACRNLHFSQVEEEEEEEEMDFDLFGWACHVLPRRHQKQDGAEYQKLALQQLEGVTLKGPKKSTNGLVWFRKYIELLTRWF